MRYWHVDAFTEAPFRGNPAAVVLLQRPLEAATLAALALEFALPATVYLEPRGAEAGGPSARDPDVDAFAIRWYTPRESGLCGHGTLAAAHALWDAGLARGSVIALQSPAGALRATREEGGWIALDFPVLRLPERAPWPALAEALGVAPVAVAGDAERTLVVLSSPAELAALQPDAAQVAALGLSKLIVTTRGDGAPYDFVSRYFKGRPDGGLDEDPVTGSAHCALAPYWAAQLDKQELLAHQASPRGGVLRVSLGAQRVTLRGQAVTLAEGTLRVV